MDTRNERGGNGLMITITVPAPCGWINSNQRLHRMQTAKLTKQWREAGKAASEGLPPFTCPVHVTAYIWKPRRGRYDVLNLWPSLKAVIDGIVDAELLADDDHSHITGPDMRHGGIGPARIVLEIEPIKETPNV